LGNFLRGRYFVVTTTHKEMYSEIYIRAVVSACGYEISKPYPDNGIDFYIGCNHMKGKFGSPKIDIQLKSTIQYEENDDFIKYDLEVKNYNFLTDTNLTNPRLLLLVTLPNKAERWFKLNPEGSIFNYCVYWYNLYGVSESPNKNTHRVEIPKNNIFFPETLTKMMKNICAGYGDKFDKEL
jgi:hypothetical protein